MHRSKLMAAVVGVIGLGAAAWTETARGQEGADATGPVKGYFAALDRQDFSRALALTGGSAQARTSRMVQTLQQQAAEQHARVEVKVRSLAVRSPGVAEPGRGVPVPVSFRID